MRPALLASVLLIAGAGPDRPPLVPTREVSVLYRLLAAGKPQTEIRISSRPGGTIRRIDLPDQSYLLIDQAAKTMAMVVPSEGTILDVPWDTGLGSQFTLSEQMRFTRRAGATVSRVACTLWDVVQDAQRGQVCVTDDGVMLRTEGVDPQGRHTAIEAVSVTYTPAPEADFAPPAGFQHVVPGRPGSPR